MNFETIIGLEVHAQLLTRSKMFCSCSADYANALPNTHVCPVCLGMPGVLPTINRQAIENAIMTALALKCTISGYTKFDRKNYPYPDLMKGYQISQYDAPIGCGGWIDIEVDGKKKKVGITRVHLEEDVAKLIHHTSPGMDSHSLMDVNRAGVPLMEIVGDPDLRSPEEARQYLVKLHTLLRYLEVSTANMEEGSFRCDANISIRPEHTPKSLAKVEIKNMNSFRAVYQALEYEATRQREVAQAGKKLVQETRGWVEEKGKTVSQRSKEYAHDYRYFPEPDLPPLTISLDWVSKVKVRLPELPEDRRNRFVAEYGLPLYDANLLTSSRVIADYEEEFIAKAQSTNLPVSEIAKLGSNWLLGEVSRIMNAENIDILKFGEKVSPEKLVKLMVLKSQSIVNAATAKSMLEEMYRTGKDPDAILKEGGRNQISDTSEIDKAVSQAIQANAHAVADYKAGKESALKFLVGQVMRSTQGRANPKQVNELIKEKVGGE